MIAFIETRGHKARLAAYYLSRGAKMETIERATEQALAEGAVEDQLQQLLATCLIHGTYLLWAEREGRCLLQPQPVGSMEAARILLGILEAQGQWPEGADAVVEGPAGRFLYSDCWEPYP